MSPPNTPPWSLSITYQLGERVPEVEFDLSQGKGDQVLFVLGTLDARWYTCTIHREALEKYCGANSGIDPNSEFGQFAQGLCRDGCAIVEPGEAHRIMRAMRLNEEVTQLLILDGTNAERLVQTEPVGTPQLTQFYLESEHCWVAMRGQTFDAVIASIPQDEQWLEEIAFYVALLAEETLEAVRRLCAQADLSVDVCQSKTFAMLAARWEREIERSAWLRLLPLMKLERLHHTERDVTDTTRRSARTC